MKNRLFKLTLFLLLGAVLTIGISWGLSGRSITRSIWQTADQGYSYYFGSGHDYALKVYRSKRVGVVRIRASIAVRSSFLLILGPRHAVEDLIPSWMSWDEEAITLPDYQRKEIIVEASGWPALALCGRSTAVWHNKTDKSFFEYDRTGVLLRPSNGDNTAWSTTWRLIPLMPMWPGFAVNTLFYSAIIWLFAFAPFKLRRYVRHKRGRCIKCAYDLRSDFSAGCPECGWGREAEG